MGESLCCDFHGKGWVRQGKQTPDWLVWIISVAVRYRDSHELYGTGAGWSGQGVVACRVECRSSMRRGWGVGALDHAGLVCPQKAPHRQETSHLLPVGID